MTPEEYTLYSYHHLRVAYPTRRPRSHVTYAQQQHMRMRFPSEEPHTWQREARARAPTNDAGRVSRDIVRAAFRVERHHAGPA